jgi:diguanylate cyclase (GGDEF)-like protein
VTDVYEVPATISKVWWLTLGMVAAAVGMCWYALAVQPEVDHHPTIPWWALLACFAGTEVFVVLIRSEKGAQSISLSEIPLVVGLAFTPVGGLLAARVLGAGAIVGFHRRQRGVKLVFNLVHFALEAATAIVVYRLVLGQGEPGEPRGWVAAFAATLLLDVLGGLTISAAISFHGGGWDWSELRESIVQGAAAAVGNTSLALVAVLVLERDVRATWLLFVVAAILHVAYRAYTALGVGHARLERLYGFASDVGSSLHAESVQETILAHARTAVDAEVAGLVLVDGLRRPSTEVVLSGEEPPVTRAVSISDTPSWWNPALHGDAAVLTRRVDARDAVAVPLRDENGPAGVLYVEGRRDDVSTFTADDVRLLETLANHARVSLDRTDLVERLRRTAAEQTHQATHDYLTGLPNRRALSTTVGEALVRGGNGRVAVVLIDLDRFKEINDTLGHHMGDEVLRDVGARLERALPAGATVARLGGDEFAIVLVDVSREEAIEEARRLLAALESPFAVAGLLLDVGGSAGVAISPEDGTDANTLLQRADVAMYDAKGRHADVAAYAAERDQYSPDRLALVAELRAAIERRELTLLYQPKATLTGGRITGVEALVRWAHPTHGMISPDDFIPLAERTGLIRPLTNVVLELALRQTARWNAQGLRLQMSINISARNLADTTLPDQLRDLLTLTGVRPEQVVLEVTEGSVMADPDGSIALLHRLRGVGVQLSIDDFGTGYSSLSYLKRLPVDEVKIDKSFVMTLPRDPKDATIVESTIDLGHRLGFRVVAEGVETEEALRFLDTASCDVVQGYLLSRPIQPEAIEALLESSANVRTMLGSAV